MKEENNRLIEVPEQDYSQYESHYSENKFWEKLTKFSKKIGLKATTYTLILYYVLQREEVPKKDKAIILGCLGYFILPLDLIPDLAPVVGYSDDVMGMMFALKRCIRYVDEEMKEQVAQKLMTWFHVSEEYVSELLREF